VRRHVVPNTRLRPGRISAILAGMYLRRKRKSARGVGYSYWHLCRTVHTARGPRQQVVASLGKLDEREVAVLRGGWGDLPSLLRGGLPGGPPPHRASAGLCGAGRRRVDAAALGATVVAPPPSGCHITFTEAVQVRPLATYEEVDAWSVRTPYESVNVT